MGIQCILCLANEMKESLLIVSGWAHDLDAITPMGNALESRFNVQLQTGAQVLRDRVIRETDFIITGSMGGLLAVELLPDSCRKLVLISSTAKFCSSADYPFGIHEKVLHRMIVQLEREPETVLNEFFKNVHHPLRESRQARSMREHTSLDVGELVTGLEYLFQSDVRDLVPQIEIPVLLLHGAEDRIIPPQASEWLHTHLPDSCLQIVENDGHALPAHHFETVIKAIQDFLP